MFISICIYLLFPSFYFSWVCHICFRIGKSTFLLLFFRLSSFLTYVVKAMNDSSPTLALSHMLNSVLLSLSFGAKYVLTSVKRSFLMHELFRNEFLCFSRGYLYIH